MPDTSIKVQNLGKRYRIGAPAQQAATRAGRLLKGVVSPFRYLATTLRKPAEAETIWALRGVDLAVSPGEVVGIIGPNGAGKSTLLKILSRITLPSEGRAEILGRVGSLLEVGTGFHPELTGRENVFLNGAVLGMRRQEIAKKFDQIVDFSGVAKFIDTPVKRYSSGMTVRLAFAVAAFLDTEVLLVDEVLAVGDADFQRRCLGKMRSVAQGGRTVLLVSHNMAAIRTLCSRTVVIEDGQVVFDGPSEQAVRRYLRQDGGQQGLVRGEELAAKTEDVKFHDTAYLRGLEIAITDLEGNPCEVFLSRQDFLVSITFQCLQPVPNARVTLAVESEAGDAIVVSENWDQEANQELLALEPGAYRWTCRLPADLFGEMKFFVTLRIHYEQMQHMAFKRVRSFKVEFQGYNDNFRADMKLGFIRPLLSWQREVIDQDELQTP